jgi:hypothetical protein
MDDLDAKIAAILGEFELRGDDWAIKRVREDVEIAQDAARATAALKLPKDAAIDFVNAAKLVIRIAREYGLATEEQLKPIRGMGTQANVRLAVTDKPRRRPWLGPCAANFRAAWEAITTKASGLHCRDEPSPTLKFVTACCQIIDPTVKPSAVRRAYHEYLAVREMTDEEYKAFLQSDLWQELSRSDL